MGDFAPGTHLDEQILAKRFGAAVRAITPDQLDMLFIAMGEIEATCSRLSTLSMNPAERGQLRSLHERMGGLAETGDHDGDVLANGDCHSLVYACAHNSVIDEIDRHLPQRMTPYRRIQFHAPGRLARSHSEHGLVVHAILARDAAVANSAMLVHMSVVEDAFETLYAGSAAARDAAGERARDRLTRTAPPAHGSRARPQR